MNAEQRKLIEELVRRHEPGRCTECDTIRALLLERDELAKKCALMEEYIDRPCDPRPGDIL